MVPNSDGDFTDSTLNFVRWDRAKCGWRTAVEIAVTGEVSYQNVAPVPVACDLEGGVRSTSLLALALAREQVPAAALRTAIAAATANCAGFPQKSFRVARAATHAHVDPRIQPAANGDVAEVERPTIAA